MIGKFILLGFVVLLHQTESLKLPNYIKACRRGDPNLNECARKNGQDAIPHLIKGDKKYKLPNLNPFVLPEVSIKQQGNLNLVFRNLKLEGLENSNLEKVNIDLDKKHVKVDFRIPKVDIDAAYEVSGRILILPITGKGPSKLHFDDLSVSYEFDFDLVKKGSEEYIKPKKGITKFDTKFFSIKMDNLFNGDKVLGPETQNFINENWKEVLNDLGPSISETLSEIINLLLQNLCESVPYNDVFPE